MDGATNGKEAALVAVEPAGAPMVVRLMYAPVKIVSKRVAPRLSARLFASLWALVDDSEPPPRPEDQQRSVGKLALALGLESACAAVVGGLLEQVSRRQFARLTGHWPERGAKP
jgi:Protein of unknown function (DUF4235)